MVGSVLELLGVEGRGIYVDCTVGSGGHALAILEAAPGTRLMGIDMDVEALDLAKRRLELYSDSVELVHGNFSDVDSISRERGYSTVDGVLFDLGLSSMQVDTASRGFSFRREARLDMRFDTSQEVTADQVVNRAPERLLADVLFRMGEEPRARRVARAIVNSRPIATTTELAEVVTRALGRPARGRIHPATRTFQAIRMHVNGELQSIRHGVERAIGVLAERGRLAVISYHSLEDRLVKAIFRRESSDCVCPPRIPLCVCQHTARVRLVNRRIVRPTPAEIQANPRSRSARLRVAERIA
jgi:16S rRNA (cytosine1402-N4)-methyltransferase